MHWRHPPELRRPSDRAQFDPIVEGARYRLSAELLRSLWQRVCSGDDVAAERLGNDQVRLRFHELASRVASRRLFEVGRMTRVGTELDGDQRRLFDDLSLLVPGRATRVTEQTRFSEVPNERLGTDLQPHTPAAISDQARSARIQFTAYRARGLGDILQQLGPDHALRRETIAAANADRTLAAGASGWRTQPLDSVTPNGHALWRAAERHAATLYRRAIDDGAIDPHDPVVESALQRCGTGQALPRELQIEMEHELGVSLAGVRLHTDAVAAQAARALNAEAFTVGDDIFFAGGAFDLDARAGRKLLAHELAHVAQAARGAAIGSDSGRRVSSPNEPLEREADAVAARIDDRAARGPAAPVPATPGSAGQTGQSPGALPANIDRVQRVFGGARAAASVIHRKEGTNDARILGDQAKLKTTDNEIPVVEGELLATRQEAVKRGLLSQAAFDAGLALSRAMTSLQPAITAKGAVNPGIRESAALAAKNLYLALQKETTDDKNFASLPSGEPSMVASISSQNRYTGEIRNTTVFLVWAKTRSFGSSLEQLPGLIRGNQWSEAFKGYRQLTDGLDLWVADQLRAAGKAKGKGDDEARGDAHQHQSELRTGLEQIADKHATRIPALFHPDPEVVKEAKAAGKPAADAIPLNVYFWKDDKTGKFHIYDLTAPSHPRDQPVDSKPTAAMLNTFFEEVARYPKGEVRFNLPDGGAGVAPTTGKIKWYEWLGYIGLGVTAVGLALFTGGESVAVYATYCIAIGSAAGGLSAAGHLVDTERLGTATPATVVLDVAQIVASFASTGAVGISIKAGGVAPALASSRWFVPLVRTAAGADVVQMVALSDITYAELSKIEQGAGSAEDKQRAMSVLLMQLVVTGGLVALSVKNASSLGSAGKSYELVEQNGTRVLRPAGKVTPVENPELPTGNPKVTEPTPTPKSAEPPQPAKPTKSSNPKASAEPLSTEPEVSTKKPDDPRTAAEAETDQVQLNRYRKPKNREYKTFRDWWEAKGKKWYPNKYGATGKPDDHQPTVARLRKLAAQEFPDDIIHLGTSINGSKTPAGKTIRNVQRNPDVWVEDATRPGVVKKVYEAARTNKNGTFVSREMDKKKQYDGLGIKSHFEMVRPDAAPTGPELAPGN